MPDDTSAGREVGFHFRDALRLLFILVRGSVPMPEPDAARGFDHVFEGEKRAMAIDFLVRYPDYLADDLLRLYGESRDPTLLDAVAAIFDGEEPDVRTVGMIRWSFGAFNNLETALAILEVRGLARAVRVSASGQARHDFLVGALARDFLAEAVDTAGELAWYDRQVGLALRVWGDASGSAVKRAQYEHPEYRDAPLGSVIPSIKDRVWRRFLTLKGAA